MAFWQLLSIINIQNMKKAVYFLAVLFLSMCLASCPEGEMNTVEINVDNRYHEDVAIGIRFYSEFRKQWMTEKYGEDDDVKALFCSSWTMPKNAHIYGFTVEAVECSNWTEFFSKEGIDTLTMAVARNEAIMNQWFAGGDDSLLVFRQDMTLKDLRASDNVMDIVIDEYLGVTIR